MRGKNSTHRGVYTDGSPHGESTHGGVHREESTHKEVYIRGEHKWEEHTRKRAHMEESCPHRGESVHTQEYTRKRAHTKECTHGESTLRSTHGESAHGGVHTGRAHKEEYTRGEHTRGDHTPIPLIVNIAAAETIDTRKFTHGVERANQAKA